MGDEVPLYASAYAGLDARDRVRRETYGEDLGQSSWMTVDELDRFGEWLELNSGSRLLDVGCGSGGPVLHLAETTRATVVGLDVLEEGIAAATAQAQARGLTETSTFVRADAGERLPFEDESFDAVLSIDAMCHLPDRLSVLEEWRRVTRPAGRVLFTDPTIITGPVTGAEIADRSAIGVYVFSIASMNGELLAEAGFDVLRREDLTEKMPRSPGAGETLDNTSLTSSSQTRVRRPSRGPEVPGSRPCARARAAPVEIRLPSSGCARGSGLSPRGSLRTRRCEPTRTSLHSRRPTRSRSCTCHAGQRPGLDGGEGRWHGTLLRTASTA
jgi:ubiquinone/menaquinone biosynthesis C-methylase UbiE